MTPVPASAQLQILDNVKDNVKKVLGGSADKSKGQQGDAKKNQAAKGNQGQKRRRARREPVAVVDAIRNAPRAGVRLMDTVYPQQSIQLGRNGSLTLQYTRGCLVENFKGGTVIVAGNQATGRSLSQGGSVRANSPECGIQQARITQDSSEAGAVIKRMHPPALINEQAINTSRPFFQLPPGKSGMVTVVISNAETGKQIYRRKTKHRRFQYPRGGNRIAPGYPHMVQVSFADGSRYSSTFSYDPGLELPNTNVSKTVFVRQRN